jgi:hypothetical protein
MGDPLAEDQPFRVCRPGSGPEGAAARPGVGRSSVRDAGEDQGRAAGGSLETGKRVDKWQD